MSENTPRLPNAYPKVGPIVINEIMYHPNDPSGDAEYVELLNISGSQVTLYDDVTNEPWKLVDDESDPGDGSHHEDFDYLIPPLDPWPTGPDGYGQSLTRIDPNLYGNDVINWRADDPSPGTANP